MFERIRFLFLIAALASAQPANPPKLVYSTYIGTGSTSFFNSLSRFNSGSVNSISADSQGHAYVSGIASGSVPGPGVSYCAYLSKLSVAGDAVLWTTCLPVPAGNSVTVAADAAGNVFALGNTSGTVWSPSLFKLTPDGQMVYSKPINCGAAAIALDDAGNIYVTGVAGQNFQTTLGAYKTTGGGGCAMKLNASGAVVYATYLDFVIGSANPLMPIGPQAIAVDRQGQAWIAGATCACQGGVTNCLSSSIEGQTGCSYGTSSAIRKLDANGASLLAALTLGGGASHAQAQRDSEAAIGIAIDAADSAWIVGTQGENQYLQPYARKLSPSGGVLIEATRLPASSISSVTVDSQGSPYFALNGQSSSTVMALSPDGSSVLLARDLRSPVKVLALDGNGGLYAAGNTQTLAFLTTPNAYQPLFPVGGEIAAFIAKFDLTQSAPEFSYIANAGSLLPGIMTPGEIVTLFGRGLPPDPQVTFDGRPAKILYVDSHQINAVVPFAVSGPTTVVSLAGAEKFTLPVYPAVPGIFTANGRGTEQVAALNLDGSVNSSANPAKAGSVVSVYLTGVGALTPPIGDGQIGPLQAPFPTPVLGVGATIDKVVTPVLFIGQAPGLIAGAIQANIQIPAGTAPGDREIVIYVGNYRTQFGFTSIAVE